MKNEKSSNCGLLDEPIASQLNGPLGVLLKKTLGLPEGEKLTIDLLKLLYRRSQIIDTLESRTDPHRMEFGYTVYFLFMILTGYGLKVLIREYNSLNQKLERLKTELEEMNSLGMNLAEYQDYSREEAIKRKSKHLNKLSDYNQAILDKVSRIEKFRFTKLPMPAGEKNDQFCPCIIAFEWVNDDEGVQHNKLVRQLDVTYEQDLNENGTVLVRKSDIKNVRANWRLKYKPTHSNRMIIITEELATGTYKMILLRYSWNKFRMRIEKVRTMRLTRHNYKKAIEIELHLSPIPIPIFYDEKTGLPIPWTEEMANTPFEELCDRLKESLDF